MHLQSDQSLNSIDSRTFGCKMIQESIQLFQTNNENEKCGYRMCNKPNATFNEHALFGNDVSSC